MAKMKIGRMVEESDRLLLYASAEPDRSSRIGEYHVIASTRYGAELKVGDEIEYEPYGINFGWLKVEPTAIEL